MPDLPREHSIETREASVTAVTRGPKHHFFGYYVHCPFDPAGRFLLAHECNFIGRHPKAEDTALLGLIDLGDGMKWIPLAETKAVNWQFGAMPQWLPGAGKRIIYNDRRDGRFVSVIREIDSGRERILQLPVFSVAPDGRRALTVDFERLAPLRPETGYVGVRASQSLNPAPDADGIFLLDLETGTSRQIVALGDMRRRAPTAGMENAIHYFTHTLWNSDGNRFLFWHRWLTLGGSHTPQRSRLCTAGPTGADIRILNAGGNSHSIWRGADQVLARATREGEGTHFYMFDDKTGEYRIVGGGVLENHGHFTFSPDGKWLLTDGAVGADHMRGIFLYHWATGRRVLVGSFRSLPELKGELRCDLHPRWNRAGTQICIDSTHEGSRQMYILDVRGIVQGM